MILELDTGIENYSRYLDEDYLNRQTVLFIRLFSKRFFIGGRKPRQHFFFMKAAAWR
jgi:hypothetical protein